MTALASSRALREVRFIQKDLPGTAGQVYKGGIACWDTATGLVVKASASTTQVPIGRFTEDKLVTSGGTVNVTLFREVVAYWFVNATAGDAVAASDIGDLAYLVDDQTVANNDATNTRSVLGRIWDFQSTKGVLVEPRPTSEGRIGGLDA
jgi:hypothetical protein